MTIKTTLATLRNLGLKARYESAFGEYRVTVPTGNEAEEEESIAYYTQDSDDAIATGKLIREQRDEHILKTVARLRDIDRLGLCRHRDGAD